MVSSSIFAFSSLCSFPFLSHSTSSTPATTVMSDAQAIAPMVTPLNEAAASGELQRAAVAVQAKLLEGPPSVQPLAQEVHSTSVQSKLSAHARQLAGQARHVPVTASSVKPAAQLVQQMPMFSGPMVAQKGPQEQVRQLAGQSMQTPRVSVKEVFGLEVKVTRVPVAQALQLAKPCEVSVQALYQQQGQVCAADSTIRASRINILLFQ